MPVKTRRLGRNGRLEEAIALLVQTQAAFVQNQASFLADLLPEMLAKLPEAVRQKIGFKPHR